MSKHARSDALDRFRSACAGGPTAPSVAPEVGFAASTSDWRERMSQGLFNLGERHQQRTYRGEVESELFKSGADTHLESQKHRDRTLAASDRRATEINAVVLDEGVERRGQQRLRSSEAWSAIHSSDAMSVVTQYLDAKIAYAATIADEKLREKFVAEQRLIAEQALTRIRLMAYDLEFDPDGLPRGELA